MQQALDFASRFLSFPPIASGFADIIGHLFLYVFSWFTWIIRIPFTIAHVFNMNFKKVMLIPGGTSSTVDWFSDRLRELLSPPVPQVPGYKYSLVNIADPNFELPYKDYFHFPDTQWEKQNLHFCMLCCKLSYEDLEFFRYTVERNWGNTGDLGLKFECGFRNYFKEDQASAKNWAQIQKLFTDIATGVLVFLGRPVQDYINRISSETLMQALRVDTQCWVISTKDAVVAIFRGTEPMSIVDWSTDFNLRMIKVGSTANPTPFGPGDVRVHEGFLAALGIHPKDERNPRKSYDAEKKIHTETHLYHAISRKIIQLSNGDAAAKKKAKKIVICGHSLGAALASVFAARFLSDISGDGFDEDDKRDGDYFLKKRRDRFGGLYTYGQPRCGNDAYVKIFKPFEDTHRVHRVVNNFDIIPRTPIGAESDNEQNLNFIGGLFGKKQKDAAAGSSVEEPSGKESNWHFFPAITSLFAKWNSDRVADVYVHHGRLHYLNTTGTFEKFTPNLVYDIIGPPASLFFKTIYEFNYVPLSRTLQRVSSFAIPWVGAVVNDHAPGDYELHLREGAIYQTRPHAHSQAK